MAPIKIYPPTKLPEKGVTDLLFNIWMEEIEVYLSQDDRFTPFMRGGTYSAWEAYDVNADRITAPLAEDNLAALPTRRAQLRTFLSIVAKACDVNMASLSLNCCSCSALGGRRLYHWGSRSRGKI